ncbi:site-specific recombinase [Leeia oryzae]|uniref:site-specific recombinase n=1 Tax=Leeia oryzae TaxID=356662 RepID=UPI00035D99C3|nr:site-specific recombinase [Leeia oryzae]
MDALLNKLLLRPEACDARWLVQLVDLLRPSKATDVALVKDRIRSLCYLLAQRPDFRRALQDYLIKLLLDRKLVHVLTDTGIQGNRGFWSALWQRVAYRILPPETNQAYLKDLLGEVFYRKNDYIWVQGVGMETWQTLFQYVWHRQANTRKLHRHMLMETLEALQVLSYRVSAIGLEPELVRNYPDIERYESPFVRQNVETMRFIQHYHHTVVNLQDRRTDARHILVLLSQCETIMQKIRKHAATHGVSVSLTRLLLRLTQSIDRIRHLLTILDERKPAAWRQEAVQLVFGLVEADNRKFSLRDLLKTNTELLALQVTEHAGRTGEHYVTTTRSEWLSMLRSAMGAGLVIGFMAWLKILASRLDLAPFGYAALYSLNYGLGFVLIHILHFTVATKQPAMTASKIAASMDNAAAKGKQQLDELTDLCVQVARSQFIAIVGNIMVAIPVAMTIAALVGEFTGKPFANPEKIAHLLHDLDPIHSLALLHAAIAGVCLFLSGLISGYYDNKSTYNRIPERLARLGWLNRLLGARRVATVTTYIGNNLGALTGNFFFGCMLGTIGTLGYMFGLPLDIRHIAFSSANWAFSMVASGFDVPLQVALLTLAGFLMVGMVNLLVSFSLALTVAIRSRGGSFGQGRALLARLGRRFLETPLAFFVPPKAEVPPETEPKS